MRPSSEMPPDSFQIAHDTVGALPREYSPPAARTQTSLAKKFGVSQRTIWAIISRKNSPASG